MNKENKEFELIKNENDWERYKKNEMNEESSFVFTKENSDESSEWFYKFMPSSYPFIIYKIYMPTDCRDYYNYVVIYLKDFK